MANFRIKLVIMLLLASGAGAWLAAGAGPGEPPRDGAVYYDNGAYGSGSTITTTVYYGVGFTPGVATVCSVKALLGNSSGLNRAGYFEVRGDNSGTPGGVLWTSGIVPVNLSAPYWVVTSCNVSVTGKYYVFFYPYPTSSGYITQYRDNDGDQAPGGTQWYYSSGSFYADGGTGDLMIRCFVKQHDVGVLRIMWPLGVQDSGRTITPLCSLVNNGEFTESYTVRMRIGNFYDQTAQVYYQGPGEKMTLSMPDCILNGTEGTQAETVWAVMSGDINPGDNMKADTFHMRTSQNDVGVTSILVPCDTVEFGTAITPACTVRNYGPTTVSYPVIMCIGATTLSANVTNHAPNQRRYVTFPNWTPAACGYQAVSCSTLLEADRDLMNDRRLGWTYVRAPDVGVTLILAPLGNADSGIAITPACSVTNYGTTTASYPVRMKVGTAYDRTATVSNHAPGTALEVTFPPSGEFGKGWQAVVCSTELDGDVATNNDKAVDSVNVRLHDGMVVAIVEPAGSVPVNTTVSPKLKIRNNGTQREAMLINLKIAPAGYSRTVTFGGGLPVGEDTIITMASWVATTEGAFTARCTIYQAVDANPLNDSLTQAFVVGEADAGVSAILRPGGAVLPGTIAPLVRVANLGGVTLSFPLAFTLTRDGSIVLTDTQSVTNLAGGATRDVEFASVTLDTGRYATLARILFSDGNPANDSLAGSVLCGLLVPGWTQLAAVPAGAKGKRVKDGGALAQLDGTDAAAIYAFKGNNRYEFYMYNSLSNAWLPKESIPAVGRAGKKKAVKKGSTLVGVAGDIFGAKGNGTLEFWRYRPSGWTQVADVPAGGKTLKEGVGSVAVTKGETTFVYLLKGGGTQEFYRYNVQADAWQTLASAPLGVSGKAYKNGSGLAGDGSSTLYALKGSYNELAAYDIATDAWSSRRSMPLVGVSGKKKKVKDGAGIAWSDGRVFALKGGNTRELWYYAPASDSWLQLEDVPTGGGKNVKGGGALVASSGMFYALKGNNTDEFFRYVPSAGFGLQAAVRKPQALEGLKLQASSLKLAVAPNPWRGNDLPLSVSFATARAGNVSLKLYDISGELVMTLSRGEHAAGVHVRSIETSRLARGIYVLRLASAGDVVTQKVIVE